MHEDIATVFDLASIRHGRPDVALLVWENASVRSEICVAHQIAERTALSVVDVGGGGVVVAANELIEKKFIQT